jgi:hypothetical protein
MSSSYEVTKREVRDVSRGQQLAYSWFCKGFSNGPRLLGTVSLRQSRGLPGGKMATGLSTICPPVVVEGLLIPILAPCKPS